MDERKKVGNEFKGELFLQKRFLERCERVNDSTKRCSNTREGETIESREKHEERKKKPEVSG